MRLTVILPETVLAEERTGLFCRLFGPVSLSGSTCGVFGSSPSLGVGRLVETSRPVPRRVYAKPHVGEDRVARYFFAKTGEDIDPVRAVEVSRSFVERLTEAVCYAA